MRDLIGAGKIAKADIAKELPKFTVAHFAEVAEGTTFKALTHSKNASTITTPKGTFQLVHCSIADKALVSIIVGADDKVVEGTEMLLQYEGVVNERLRFNAISELPSA